LPAAFPSHYLARIGRDPQLRIDPGDGHLSGTDLGSRQYPLGGYAVSVGFEGGAFIDGLDLGHDPVGLDRSVLGDIGRNHDQVVELQIVIILQDDAKLPRGGVLGSQHSPNASLRPRVLAHRSSRSRDIMALTSAAAWLLLAAPGR
jgi:hypothetical protein